MELRFQQMMAEWILIAKKPPPDLARFDQVKAEADAAIAAGSWTSGPGDLLSILGRQRDELTHSRIIGWLLVPTNQHGLGRRFLDAFVSALWPGDALLRSGPVRVEIEMTRSASDDVGDVRAARADIVLSGDGVTVLIENKLDAGEQPDQCERLYWAWVGEPVDTRWVFLSPTGRAPVTATSEGARAAWRTMSYTQLRGVLASAMESAGESRSLGRASVVQYFASLAGAAVK
jgi:hypothetical protein